MFRRVHPTIDCLIDFQESIANITALPLPHREPMLDILPHLSKTTPLGYRPLSSSQVAPSLASPTRGSLVPDLV